MGVECDAMVSSPLSPGVGRIKSFHSLDPGDISNSVS